MIIGIMQRDLLMPFLFQLSQALHRLHVTLRSSPQTTTSAAGRPTSSVTRSTADCYHPGSLARRDELLKELDKRLEARYKNRDPQFLSRKR